MIKVLLVDDHELVRTGINDSKGIEVVGEAETGEDAIRLGKELKPQVVLMDVNMPGIGGLEATRKLLQYDPEIKVIVVTVHAEAPFPTRLLEAGATGYLSKDCGFEEIISAIRAVNEGERYIASEIAQQIAVTVRQAVTARNAGDADGDTGAERAGHLRQALPEPENDQYL